MNPWWSACGDTWTSSQHICHGPTYCSSGHTEERSGNWNHYPAIWASGCEALQTKGIHKWGHYMVHCFASTRWCMCCWVCLQILGASESDNHSAQHSTANVGRLILHSNTHKCRNKYIILLLHIWHWATFTIQVHNHPSSSHAWRDCSWEACSTGRLH